MQKTLLEKWKRNQVFEAIKAVGLNPRDFELDEDHDQVRIKRKRSSSWFTIHFKGAAYVTNHVVGDSPEWGPIDA